MHLLRSCGVKQENYLALFLLIRFNLQIKLVFGNELSLLTYAHADL